MDRGLSTYLELLRDALRERIVPAAQGAPAQQAGALATGVLTRLAISTGLAPTLERDAFAQRKLLLAEYAPYLDGRERDEADHLLGVLPGSASDADLDAMRRSLDRVYAVLDAHSTPEARRAAARILAIDARIRQSLEDAFRSAMAAPASAGSGPPAALSDEESAALTTWLRQQFPEEAALQVASSRALAGGFSRSTLFVELSGTKSLPSAVVIRRDGQVLHSGNSVGFEYPILKELSDAGLPVPKPLASESSGTVLGRPFLVVSRLEGATFGDTIDVSIQDRALSLDLARQLARLHRVPAERFGHVHGSNLRIVDRVRGEIEADHRAWRTVGPPCLPMDAAFAWLARNMASADGPVALVHRDIGGHNLLAHGHRINAILDWEIAVVGNPAEDLGYVRYTIDQLGDWDAFLDAYSEAAGWRPPQASLDFYTLWGAVRLAVLIGKARAGVRAGQFRDLGLVYVSEHFMPRFISRVAETMERLIAR